MKNNGILHGAINFRNDYILSHWDPATFFEFKILLMIHVIF